MLEEKEQEKKKQDELIRKGLKLKKEQDALAKREMGKYISILIDINI